MAHIRGRTFLLVLLLALLLIPTVSNRTPRTDGSSSNLTFSESGLPSGTMWTVTLNGTAQSSTTSKITFYNPLAGTYFWTASFPNGSITGVRYAPYKQNDTVNFPAQTAVSITYSAQYYFTGIASPSNEGTVSPASGWFASGSKVTVSVQPDQGYAFTNWTGSGQGSYTGNTNTIVLTMNNPISETANLLPAFGVIFNEVGLLAGTSWAVTLNGHTQTTRSDSVAFVILGTGIFGWTVLSQIEGSATVQYVPVSAFGSVNLPKDAGQSGVANVAITYVTQYYVNILTSNTGGSVTPKSGWFDAGKTLPVFASANPGFNFTGWQVSNSSSSLPQTVSNSSVELIVVVNGPGTITALFSEFPSHGQAISNNGGGFLSGLTDNPAFADPYVQLAILVSLVGIVMVSVFFVVKRWFTPEG